MTKKIPKISIVTTSYNRDQFLEEAILSVLSQDYPNIEHIIIDGASTDNSLEIIHKYEDKIAYWVSEPDEGPVQALNKGFSKSTGDIMAILNSDDKYTPWALKVVGDIFSTFSNVDWLTTLYPLMWDKNGLAIDCLLKDGFSRRGFYRGEYLSWSGRYSKGCIQAESTFWRRSLWRRAGGYVDGSNFAADFELWARFFKYSELYGVRTPLGGFRMHNDQFSLKNRDKYVKDAKKILHQCGGRPYGRLESFFRSKILHHIPSIFKPIALRLGILYPYKLCKHTGRNGGWEIFE